MKWTWWHDRLRLRLRVHVQWIAWVVFLPFIRVHDTPGHRDLVGLAMVALGLGLRAWAAGHLDKARRGDALAVSGPYRWIRHPLYLGSLMLAAGLALVSGAPAIACALVLATFVGTHIFTLLREERLVAERFPEAHRAWRARTGLLWPGLGCPPAGPWRATLYMANGEYWATMTAAAGLVGLWGAGRLLGTGRLLDLVRG